MGEIIIDLIANITSFITYFIPGYIFISCFNYTSCLPRESEMEYLFIKSISFSYIFYVATSFLGRKMNMSMSSIQVITFLEVIVFGCVFGRLHRTEWVNKLSIFLFKRRMSNNIFVDIWEESNKNDTIVFAKLILKDNLGTYKGQIKKIELYNNDPAITLSYYSYCDANNEHICDYSSMDHANVIVKYSEVQLFEYVLNTKSAE